MTNTFTRLRRNLLKGIALTFFGASLLSGAAFAEDKPDVIRIGTTAPGHLKFILGRHDGAFEKEFAKDGIKVELVAFTNGGSEALTALATGAIEVTYTGNNPALRAAALGADVKAIGLSSFTKNSSTTIIVKPDSPIKTVADLKGKKVAFLAGTVRHSVFSKALKTVGLTTDDVEPLNLDFAASGPSLIRGDVDAVVESDNSTSKLVEKGEARVILDSNKYPEWSAPFIISVNGEFAKKYPDLVKRLLKVDIQLARWADAHPEDTIKIFVDETKTSEKSVRNTYADGKFYQDPRITPEAIKALQDEEAFMAEAKLLKGSVDYDTWIDTSYLDAAYKEVDSNQ
ncbi:ABC transporter substrate-binding protein [Rhizobium sp. Root73]|uniref:aliphatic sulfonate ABC transporter substrate-binding protein n=1 Tax=unclassified Rhizobium TaxID=2613769 RepID=UPI00072AC415|nr:MULTISPECIES: aliphatic sulfonate ABC transporter substrate-binding protein [unclassified Rhizobium]KQY14905.1 ABC transporter substrate-binding protein [Rhizobium sp. Root1334]KRC06344.1 ABC transporter substrate-binding protein [Rhizobium sp. Root73]